jgi:hypothetical protein
VFRFVIEAAPGPAPAPEPAGRGGPKLRAGTPVR